MQNYLSLRRTIKFLGFSILVSFSGLTLFTSLSPMLTTQMLLVSDSHQYKFSSSASKAIPEIEKGNNTMEL